MKYVNNLILITLIILASPLTHASKKWDLKKIKNNMNEVQQQKMLMIPNFDLLPRDRVSFKDKIGENSAVIYLGFYDKDGNYVYYCTGALLGPQLVITSKHCLRKKETAVIYAMADKYNQGIDLEDYSQVVAVVDECPKSGWCKEEKDSLYIDFDVKDYTSDYAKDDMVFLFLGSELKSKDGYFELPDKGYDFKSEKLQMAGFPDYAMNINNSTVKYISEPVCDYVAEIDNALITNCIPAGGISGGPLFYKKNGKQYLVGIVSSPIGPIFDGDNKIPYSGTRAYMAVKSDLVKGMISLSKKK